MLLIRMAVCPCRTMIASEYIPPLHGLKSRQDFHDIWHAVEVSATPLYEVAVLAMAEFRRLGFTANAPGPGTRLTVNVKTPVTSHEVQWGKVETWLHGAGKPN